MRAYRLKNPLMKYPWGSRTAIPELLGIRNENEEPFAELWMGAHPLSPSLALEAEGGEKGLDALISSSPKTMLGPRAGKYGNALPFLFKVLSAGSPLSIQAHPSRIQAFHGFMKEERAGIPLDAPERNYKDKNHKPELICALTEFEGMCSFRPIPEILENLRQFKLDSLDPLARPLKAQPGAAALAGFFREILAMDADSKRALLRGAAISARLLLEGGLPGDQGRAAEWLIRLIELYPEDIGALCPLLLNMVRLEPGEALFLDAGELHAYLMGTGLEIMANSDNVLRGGLTSKHVDIPELMSVLSFRSGKVSPILPEPESECEESYPAPATEFRLSRLALKLGSRALRRGESPEILLCVEGSLSLSFTEKAETLSLGRGESAFVPALSGAYELSGNALAFKAALPSSRGRRGGAEGS